MIISQLEVMDKSKVRVYIDDEYAFLLYQKDIRHYQLQEGKEISEDLLKEILEDTVLRRAKQKALAILKFMDRTEQELRMKLSDSGYTDKIIDHVVEYINGYGYISDNRYASMYIRSKKNYKSKRMLQMELQRKGVDKGIIEEVLSEEYEDPESENPEILAIRREIAKKRIDVNDISWEEKQKLTAALYRKGFEIDKINQVLR